MSGMLPKLLQDIGGRPTPEMSRAFNLLLDMTDEQRKFIFCWFCKGCNRYVGPGDRCHCRNDE